MMMLTLRLQWFDGSKGSPSTFTACAVCVVEALGNNIKSTSHPMFFFSYYCISSAKSSVFPAGHPIPQQ